MLTRKNLPRLLGFVLLGVLLLQIERGQFVEVVARATAILVIFAILLNVPGVLLKALRWRWMLRAQGISYGVVPSYLAYFGSIFIGLLTPGRLGEFIKALYVSRDCNIPAKQAFSSVLADRLFDLYALSVVGGVALINLGSLGAIALATSLSGLALTMVIPPVLLLNERTFAWAQALGKRFGKLGRKLFGAEGWIVELRYGLKQLTPPWALLAVALTVLAYGVFYLQAYLLAVALHLDASILQVSYAVSLGSLVTLIPISISGIGTREAAIVAYLGTVGVSAEAALGFSLLVFATFYLGTGLIGSVAWLLKPVRWERGGSVMFGDVHKATASDQKNG